MNAHEFAEHCAKNRIKIVSDRLSSSACHDARFEVRWLDEAMRVIRRVSGLTFDRAIDTALGSPAPAA